VAQTPEAKVKAKVVAQLKTLGAYYFYPVTGGYGGSGVPDIVGCLRGTFFAIECKAGNRPHYNKRTLTLSLSKGAWCG
jgi:Holliday junction resolvase